MFLISEGEVEVTIAGKTTTLGPGSVAFAAAGDEHQNSKPRNKACAVLRDHPGPANAALRAVTHRVQPHNITSSKS